MKIVTYSFITILMLMLVSCESFNKETQLTDFIPEHTHTIIRTRNLSNFTSNLSTNEISGNVADNFLKDLNDLPQIEASTLMLICITQKDSTSQQTIISQHNDTSFLKDSIIITNTRKIKLQNEPIHETTINSKKLFTLIRDSILISSTDKKIISDIINEKNNPNNQLQKLITTTSNPNSSSVIINSKSSKSFNYLFNNEFIPFAKFTNYLSFDTETTQNQVLLSGIAKSIDSSRSLINIFKNTIPQENTTARITPTNADSFFSFTYDDFDVLKENLTQYKLNDTLTNSNNDTSLFDTVNEIGIIQESNNYAIALHSIDNLSTKETLVSEQTKIEDYRGVSLFKFSTPSLFSDTFNPLITFNEAKIYFVLDDFFIFTKSKDDAYNIIANHQNKTTISNKDYYKKLNSKLSDEASILYVFNAKTLQSIISKNTTKQISNNLKNYKASAIQFIYDTNFAHFNSVIEKSRAKNYYNSVTEKLNIRLKTDILNTPQLVTNHTNKTKDIVVQDINNVLYLITNSGKIIWKKQLNGPIIGKVKQIDIMKNGRLQLVFATPKRLYVISRNGKIPKPFPLKFNDNITQPLSVFDYDKNKNYRFLVTQGSNVLMYDKKGKKVKGFKFKKAKGEIIHEPQHFRLRSNDYIVIKTEKHVHILSRTGKVRITPKTKTTYSKEGFYNYRGLLTTSTKNGNIIRIDQKGNVSTQRKRLGENHAIDATSKTLVTQNNNKLVIRSNALEMDLGNYTRPKIFYLKNKIYVALTDLQTQKVYLFNSLGKPIDNFPVYGNSLIELDNIDKDKQLEFITKGDKNTILIYDIN